LLKLEIPQRTNNILPSGSLHQQIGAIHGTVTNQPSQQRHYNGGSISALKTLCKDRACYELIKPRLLDFNEETGDEDEVVKKDKEKETPADDDLSKPFKATSKCPFTRRIINFTAPNHRMPTNVNIYDGMSDPANHITRFTGMGNSAE
ncbi:hypothetical protein Tco_1472222, partial [Tanacetum coccineum]